MTVYSNGVGADRIQGAVWRKSRISNAEGTCVEAAKLREGGVALRNSRDPKGPALIYTAKEMEAFLAGVRQGDFDFLLN
ncbi:DUF397 domain-containing protein [Streptomyces carpaticus]|uniref:DUF397 domain-containing protein n=1 Tax=Streptomyces carpaticus TaxID=285558 RepID=UPI0021FFE7C9|nr:DUF397 domain-containing protein [Streptomyces carpaticus]